MKRIYTAATLLAACLGFEAHSADALTVTIGGLNANGSLPNGAAYCTPSATDGHGVGTNVNPKVSWTPGPEGTLSYALVMVDPDVPSVFDDANKENKILPASMPRKDFYHWLVTDIPASVTSIAEGKASEVTGVAGTNDFAVYKFDAKPHTSYDGPCPPWNDELLHRYYFKVYALNVKTLGLLPSYTGPEFVKALEGHVLAEGQAIGTFTTNLKGTK